MATWKADVFVNSRVGQITTTVEAATFSGAEEQIYAKHGDVQSIEVVQWHAVFVPSFLVLKNEYMKQARGWISAAGKVPDRMIA